MNSFGIALALAIYFLALYSLSLIRPNGLLNLVQVLILLELMLLGIGVLLVNASFYLDDLIGATLTIYLLILVGAESAIALALMVAFYPTRFNLILLGFGLFYAAKIK